MSDTQTADAEQRRPDGASTEVVHSAEGVLEDWLAREQYGDEAGRRRAFGGTLRYLARRKGTR